MAQVMRSLSGEVKLAWGQFPMNMKVKEKPPCLRIFPELREASKKKEASPQYTLFPCLPNSICWTKMLKYGQLEAGIENSRRDEYIFDQVLTVWPLFR